MTETPKDRIVEMSKQLFALKEVKEGLEERLKETNKQIEQLATVELAKLMADSETEKLTLAGLGTAYLSDVFHCNVLKEDRPKLYDWLKTNGHGDLVQDWVFPQTLTAFLKEQQDKNQPVPDCVRVSYIPTVKTRRS